MPRCPHCGTSAGPFRAAHRACLVRYREGRETILARLVDLETTGNAAPIRPALVEQAEAAGIPLAELDELCRQTYLRAIDRALDDDILTVAEQARLDAFAVALELPAEDPALRVARTRIEQAALLRKVLEDDSLPALDLGGYSSFHLDPEETLVAMISDVDLYRPSAPADAVPHRQHAIARGVYLATRAFHRRNRSLAELHPVATGALGFSDSRILFQGGRNTFALPYAALSSIHPFEDGLELATEDRGYVLLTHDAWFAGNLALNLARRAGTLSGTPTAPPEDESASTPRSD